MEDRWYFRSANSEGGPLKFAQLQRLVRTGELKPHEQVRKQGETWRQVRHVRDLIPNEESTAAPPLTNPAPIQAAPIQAAPIQAAPIQAAPIQAAPIQAAPVRPTPVRPAPRENSTRVGRRGVGRSRLPQTGPRRWPKVALALLPLAAGVLMTGGWLLSRPERFPQRVQTPLAESSPERIAARAIVMRAPIPRVPSIPGLPVGTPTLLPGLEELDSAFSPALSADLRIIVFGAMGNPGTGYDLYVAARSTPSEAFGSPLLISSCVTPECEAYPALSPDGLELIFARSDSEPVLMTTRRSSRNEEFPPPTEWACPHLNDEGQRLGFPQFVDARHIAYSRSQSDQIGREILISEQVESGSGFGEAELLPMEETFPLYFISANRMRAYYGSEHGLGFTIRSQREIPFGVPRPLASPDVSGPIEGPIWVCPKEDVIVYCSAGVGQQPGSSRRLWMLRY